MDKMVLRIFQSEVEVQCNFAMMAFKDIEKALEAMERAVKRERNFMKEDMDHLWYSVQAFLVAAGNVSKLLWPIKEQHRKRGVELRESLSVRANSPLEPRKFRNHFEHFDERLDDWATASEQKNFVDCNIVSIAGPGSGDCLRNFDPEKFAVTFRGDEYPLEPVISAIKEIHRKASEEFEKHFWEE